MNSFHLLRSVLWILPLSLQAAVAFVMLRRRLLSDFPIFFSYTLAVLSREIVLMFLKYPGNLYAVVYWYGEALTNFLALGAIFQTVRHLFLPYPFLKTVLKVAWTLGAVAAVLAILLLVITQVVNGGDRFFVTIMLAERSVKFLEAFWLILIIAFISHFEWKWQQYSIGIAAGFGVHSALALAVFELRGHLHLVSNPTFVMLNSAAYNVAALIWAFYFLRPWPSLSLERLPVTNLCELNNVVAEYFTHQWYRR